LPKKVVVKGDRLFFRSLVGVDNGKPRFKSEIHGKSGHCCEEEIVVFQHLFKSGWANEVDRAFWNKNAIVVITAAISSLAGEEFAKEFCVLW